ncbi:MAG: TRAP transporter large permease subunit [Pseudomonadota bacterium]
MIDLSPEYWTMLMFGGLLIGLFMGHPLAFVLGGLGVIFGCLVFSPAVLYLFMNRIYGTMDNYILIAVPLFILMAQLLTLSGVAEELFNSMRYVFGPLRGGLAVTVVVVSTLFGACTGIVGASVVTMGLMAMPVMLKYGYDKRLSAGVICGGGTLGILIPPSVMLIIMGNEAGESVGKLFAAAIIPGLILSALFIIYVLVKCYFNPQLGPPVSREERDAVTWKRLIRMLLKSLVPPMILILGVLGSIFTGIATPTEASGVGAFLSFLLILAYRKFSWSSLFDIMIQTARTTSMVIFVVVGASCFATVFIQMGGGDVIKNLMMGVGLGKWGVFIIMMIINFLLGMFIDYLGIIMITFPVFLPIVDALGFDRLWFVVVTAIMLQDSFLTPPFGYALFYLKAVAPPEVKMEDIYRGAFPFFELQEVGLIICIFLPQTITWLPSILVN